MNKTLDQYLLEACGKSKNDLSGDNPFRQAAFDGDKPRLGWVKALPYSYVEKELEKALITLKDKEYFVFVGMGGSINGVKTIIALFKKEKLFTLDSLDPAALKELLSKIDLAKTLVVSISKSGTTQESQLLTASLREAFQNSKSITDWKKHFLFLADPGAFEKLDALGWQGVTKLSIQCDDHEDIGGRFSSPQTFLFLLPLYLCLNSQAGVLKKAYEEYAALQPKIQKAALDAALTHKDQQSAFFAPYVKKEIEENFSAWITQLFQESIGSKKKGLAVKTFCTSDGACPKGFSLLKLEPLSSQEHVDLMSQMYFFQLFVAFYAALKSLNFVDQQFVETYKQEMRKLQSQGGGASVATASLAAVIKEVGKRITPKQKFIEIVLFAHESTRFVSDVRKDFSKAFGDKTIFVFIGSDWNHHSYQAAFADENTFFVLLSLAKYSMDVPSVSKETLAKNVKTLALISQATYSTIKEKAVLYALTD